MTIIDVDFYSDLALCPTAYDEAHEITYQLRDLAGMIAKAECQQLAHGLTQTVELLVRALGDDAQLSFLGSPLSFESEVGDGSARFRQAVELLLRFRDLAAIVSRTQLDHLAYRLSQVTNDIVYIALR